MRDIAPVSLVDTVAALRAGHLDLHEHVDALLDRIEALDATLLAVLPEPGGRERLHADAADLLERYPDPATPPEAPATARPPALPPASSRWRSAPRRSARSSGRPPSAAWPGSCRPTAASWRPPATRSGASWSSRTPRRWRSRCGGS